MEFETNRGLARVRAGSISKWHPGPFIFAGCICGPIIMAVPLLIGIPCLVVGLNRNKNPYLSADYLISLPICPLKSPPTNAYVGGVPSDENCPSPVDVTLSSRCFNSVVHNMESFSFQISDSDITSTSDSSVSFTFDGDVRVHCPHQPTLITQSLHLEPLCGSPEGAIVNFDQHSYKYTDLGREFCGDVVFRNLTCFSRVSASDVASLFVVGNGLLKSNRGRSLVIAGGFFVALGLLPLPFVVCMWFFLFNGYYIRMSERRRGERWVWDNPSAGVRQDACRKLN